MKTIMVPTDFSTYAQYALKVAANVAKKINAEIKLVHSCNLYTVGNGQYYVTYNKECIKIANEQLDKLMKLKFLKGISIKKHILSNLSIWEALKDKRFKDTELIVMGSHGESGFMNAFIGSNADKTIRLADVPVLTIKNEIENFTVNKMVFASNFFKESYQVFEKIKFFADLYKSHIDLLKIITPRNFESTPRSQKLIADFVKRFNLKKYAINIYNANHIENGILDFSHQQNSDLIAIETHGRTGLAHLINGSLTENIIKHDAKPVMSVKIPKPPINLSKSIMSSEAYLNWGYE